LSPALRAELDRRLDELEEHPERCLSLEESDRRIKRLLRRTQPKRCSR
jgi:flagellar motility protein MotE (MotC chaperone)